MIVTIILVERFGIPNGGDPIPVTIPLMLAFVGIGHLTGRLRLHHVRTPLILTMALAALGCTLAQVATGQLPSVLSLGLLLCLYVPAMFRSTEGPLATHVAAGFYVRVMTVAAAVGLLQYGVQFVGVPNVDWIGTLVPQSFLVQGFSPNAFITYGSPYRRSNAFLFLEPSFLSLFLGLAIVVALRRGARWPQVTLLLAGMVPTLAGNGIVILIPGVLILLFSSVRRHLLALVPGLVAGLVAALTTPLGRIYLSRSTEASSAGSSSSLRFVEPYSFLLPPSFDSTFHALVGHGAGAADTFLNSTGLAAVTRPAIPKALFEYGVLGGGIVIAVLLIVMIQPLARRPWLVGLLVAFFFINASLLTATLVAFTVFWLFLLPDRDDGPLIVPRDLRSLVQTKTT